MMILALAIITGPVWAQGYAADDGEVLHGSRSADGILRGPPPEPPRADFSNGRRAPEYGADDRISPGYGGSVPGYGGPAPGYGGSAPAYGGGDPGYSSPYSTHAPAYSGYAAPPSGYPLHAPDDGGAAYRSRSGMGRQAIERQQQQNDLAVALLEQERTQRLFELQRQYNQGRTTRQSLDAGTASIMRQSNDAIAQRQRGLSR